MKKVFLTGVLCLALSTIFGQETASEKKKQEGTAKYGNILNLSIGFTYGASYGKSLPVLANYEFDIAKNFTLAPFISYYSFSNFYYWSVPNFPGKNYNYRTTVVPFGVKGTYYFDELMLANEKWDFYLALSLGYSFRKTNWDDGYAGPVVNYTASSAYLDLHAGAEVHLSEKIGLFLDMSTGVSSFGISIKTR